jgi:peptide/nickel transport system ATP-binding protein
MTKILEIKDLKVCFKNGTALNEVVKSIGFDLIRGEILGIVGESGSGKTVTALSIMQLLDHDNTITSGKINYFEKKGSDPVDLLSIPESDLYNIRGRKIGMVFQEPMTSLNPVHRCGDQVAEAIILHDKISQDVAKNKVLGLFKRVQLNDVERIWSAYPHELSGGQKQRVMLAMALSCNPQILIADEPTTSLDVTVQKSILEMLVSLQQELHLSVIFITHDLGVISDLAHRVIVMHEGEIVEHGLVENLFQNPVHAYTKGLLACRPPLSFKVKRLLTITDFMESNKTKTVEAGLLERMIPDSIQEERYEQLLTKEPLMRVSHLSTWFPVRNHSWGKSDEWLKAVDDVSFDIYPGETLGLVGESGCGKTTLGRTLLRLIPANAGQIKYKETDITRLTAEEWRIFCQKMQIVFQDPFSSLNPRMPIGEAIMEPLIVHRKYASKESARERVNELLNSVGLKADHFDRLPHEFSGGQRQRICIARALALEPEFLICDESVSALDVSVQAQVLNLLMDLKEKLSFTSIFISHDLSVVNCISDRIMVMNQGRVEEIGFATDILNRPQSEYTRKLINAIPGRKKYSN